MTLELQRLLREAHDEGAAVGGIGDRLERLRRARATQTRWQA